MTVTISPNLKKVRTRIDVNGNEINPETKEIIVAEEKPFTPSPELLASASAKKAPTQEELNQARQEIREGKIEVETPKLQTVDNSPSTENPFIGIMKEVMKTQMKEQMIEAMKQIDTKELMKETLSEVFKK